MRGQATLWTGNASSGTHNLDSGSFANYQWVRFIGQNGQNNTGGFSSFSIDLPTDYWQNNPAGIYDNSVGQDHWLTITRASDTSFTLTPQTGSDTFELVRIYGVA